MVTIITLNVLLFPEIDERKQRQFSLQKATKLN